MSDGTPLQQLADLNQAVWLDSLKRDWLTDGTLEAFIADGVVGVTTNPTIFAAAISGSSLYDDDIHALAAKGLDDEAIFTEVEIADVQAAADLLRTVYDGSNSGDGMVSIELEPGLAADTEGSIARGLELWKRVDRPNVLVKVPATEEGLPVIEELIAAGVNVNVTLLFGIDWYAKVIDRYLTALERRQAKGESLLVHSVASFFVSRVDTAVDAALEADGSDAALALRGKVGVANVAAAWDVYVDQFGGPRFHVLREAGAAPQRPLWASTGTKNAAYSDILYIQDLIAPGTVNTMPEDTLRAFEQHGKAHVTLTDDARIRQPLAQLAALGIELQPITDGLIDEGVQKFATSFDELLASIAKTRQSTPAG